MIKPTTTAIDNEKRQRIEAALRECILRQRTGISFVELVDAAGPDAVGDFCMSTQTARPLNIFFWFNVSGEFSEAFANIREMIEIVPTSVMVYLIDGRVPSVPVAKRPRKYKEPHWAPVTVKLKQAYL